MFRTSLKKDYSSTQYKHDINTSLKLRRRKGEDLSNLPVFRLYLAEFVSRDTTVSRSIFY